MPQVRPPALQHHFNAEDLLRRKLPLLSLIALTLLLGWGWPLRVLGLRDDRSDRWIFARVVYPGNTFALGYTHSVMLKPVWDFYTVDEHYQIIQNKVVFPGSGFGLPSEARGDEIHTSLADGNECISGMRRLIPAVSVRVERAYNNTFTFGETLTIDLSQLLGDCVIDMRIHRSNPIRYTLQALGLFGDQLWDTRQNSKSRP
jgi:hypothetical protein